MSIIKTPDQKIRVFISSTINELSDERKAARKAISNLRLIPVYFEAGARPHPPRDLYSAYLEQSHIFLGIYWNSYGWTAPGAEISGLEDEYRLCGNKKPKLIYVKESGERQPQLDALLRDIENSETACYQKFTDAAELTRLIENDLSVLMSEIFETALFEQQHARAERIEELTTAPQRKWVVPPILSEIIGRESDMRAIEELLMQPHTRVVNVLGSGGTGKTTLAIHLAHRLKAKFDDGVVFVDLAAITDANQVGAIVAEHLELQDSGKQSIGKTVTDYLKDKNLLLILDNFEQILDAAQLVNDIAANCTDVKVLVTSRSALNLRTEHIYHLMPLSVPGEQQAMSDGDFMHVPAVALFLNRAKAVNQFLQLDDINKRAIGTICNKLDGLPLAIELAASRTKLYTPAALLQRMHKLLDLASRGQKDLPLRQQTLYNTIDWSYNLLDPQSRDVFQLLGIFKRSWTLEAADAILQETPLHAVDIEDITEKLLNVSLIKPDTFHTGLTPRFNMLQTVSEFAEDALKKSELHLPARNAYCAYYLQRLNETEDKLWSTLNETLLDWIEVEYQNIRTVFLYYIEEANYENAWRLIYLMAPYWTLRGGFTDALEWIEKAGISGGLSADALSRISVKQQAQTYNWVGFIYLYMVNLEPAFALLSKAETCAETCNDTINLALALTMNGAYGIYMQAPNAAEKIEKAKTLLDQIHHPFVRCTFLTWTFEYFISSGNRDLTTKNIREAKEIAQRESNAYILSIIYIIEFHFIMMQGDDFDAETFYNQSLAFYSQLPAKGYTSQKGGALGGACHALLQMERYEEAWPILSRGLECARKGGEKESLYHSVMQASYYCGCIGETETACKLFGAADNFIETTQFPLFGGIEIVYNKTKQKIFNPPDSPVLENWRREGMKLPLEDAILLAINHK